MEKEKIPKELHEGLCSYYATNKAKQNTVVTLAQFVTAPCRPKPSVGETLPPDASIGRSGWRL